MASGFVGSQQLPGLASSLKTTYEGIDDGDTKRHLDSERLGRLGHNSFGFSRASFVANRRKRGFEEEYMLGLVLGRGATATVYQSLNYQTCQKVAVKAIQKKFVRDEKLWQNEIQIHRAVDNPNIVRLLDVFEDDSMVYLILELCEGRSLNDHIDNEGEDGNLAMPEEEVLQVFEQMVSGVHYLHQRGIVHRDIKPGNFICDTAPEDAATSSGSSSSKAERLKVKLADFGVSAYIGDKKHLLTKSVGSDGYIAPEVLRRQPYTEKADIFSLGCILHAMLTGSPPNYQDGVHILDEKKLQAASEESRSLLSNLMQPRPEERLSTESLLQLPALKRAQPARAVYAAGDGTGDEMRAPSCNELVDRLQAYASFPLLKKAAVLAMVSKAESYSEFEPLTEKFLSVSSSINRSCPRVTSQDICAAWLEEQLDVQCVQPFCGLSGCRLHHTVNCKSRSQLQCRRDAMQSEIEGLVNKIESSGEISYSEWLAATMDSSWYMDPSRIAATFRLFDQDGDGLVSVTDLEDLLPDVFERFSQWTILQGTQLTDSRPLSINEDNFSRLILSTEQLIE
jgi:serine/threonine protein kinase